MDAASAKDQVKRQQQVLPYAKPSMGASLSFFPAQASYRQVRASGFFLNEEGVCKRLYRRNCFASSSGHRLEQVISKLPASKSSRLFSERKRFSQKVMQNTPVLFLLRPPTQASYRQVRASGFFHKKGGIFKRLYRRCCFASSSEHMLKQVTSKLPASKSFRPFSQRSRHFQKVIQTVLLRFLL